MTISRMSTSGQTAQWRRGRYLVEGLGHCGACHTPRNAFGAKRRRKAFAGGFAEGWLAPALNAASPDPVPWNSRMHARVVRPPSYGAQLTGLDTSGVEKMPGVIKIVRDGSFLAVVAAKEFQAISAMRALADAAQWKERDDLPDQSKLFELLPTWPAKDYQILDAHAASSPGSKTLSATFHRAYQLHGSIGPSCAVAQFVSGKLTVWTHTQGVFPLRAALAQLLALQPGQIRCIQCCDPRRSSIWSQSPRLRLAQLRRWSNGRSA